MWSNLKTEPTILNLNANFIHHKKVKNACLWAPVLKQLGQLPPKLIPTFHLLYNFIDFNILILKFLSGNKMSSDYDKIMTLYDCKNICGCLKIYEKIK